MHLYKLFVLLLAAAMLPLWAALPVVAQEGQGAFYTGEYRNVLAEYGIPQEEIDARINEIFEQFFYGDDDTERVYYPVGDDMAYIYDTGSEDVRTEGMSYGMMVAVQLDKQEEFDRIWRWTRTYMYNEDAPFEGYFAWHCTREGDKIDSNPASDGEVWFVMSLLFASARWGNGEGILNYEAEAYAILNTMLHKEDGAGGIDTNLFDEESRQIVFVPRRGEVSQFTDPSYHMPHYYELWARWAPQDNDFWAEAATASREFFHNAAHPETALMTNYAHFDGQPKPWGDYGDVYYADAWRLGMNIGTDWAWFGADPWQVTWANDYLRFFYEQGIDHYSDKYSWDGEPLSPWHSEGLVATNAVAAGFAADDPVAAEFIEAFWDTPFPTGQWRYYSGWLYLMSLLHLSGNFQIYTP